MIRLILFFLLSLAASAVAGLIKDELVGHWRYANERLACDYVFLGDGTFTGDVSHEGVIVWTYEGTWSISGDVLNYKYTKSSVEQVPAGHTDQDRVIEITEDHYVVETRDGSKHRYWRVTK